MSESTAPHKHINRLVNETSPYLLQHAHNPVDWHPWGEEALEKARRENKPIFLSIGYSACHWCHVMERECFEDEGIAGILNQCFISIKVDREERPDLDDLYMQSVQLMTGHGGWPMSVFLTPKLEPFFGGTYFPREDRPPMIGFRRLLLALAEMHRNEPDRITESSRTVLDAIREQEDVFGIGPSSGPSWGVIERATKELDRRFDSVHGGFGPAPKFPPSMAIHLLMREYLRRGDLRLIEMAERTLTKMALGGMYDQIGGGFARYSTDERWLVPHFEKMLYDNALLAPAYFNAGALTGNAFYTSIGADILDYILRDMTAPEGGFYSAEDADSEGEEGKFYVWSRAEFREVVGPADADLLCDYLDVTDAGNFEGHNIPNVVTPLEEFARRKGLDPADATARIQAARARLFAHRERRIHPYKDTKIITAWNGMMISAFCRGAQVTGDPRHRGAAERAARFILDYLRDSDGRLLRTWGAGRAKISAFCDDHAFMAAALIDLYETTFDPAWLESAAEFADRLLSDFYDPKSGGFFTTDGRDASVLIRRKDVYDGATPSGNSTAVNAFLRLAVLLDRADLREAALKTINAMEVHLTRMTGGVHHLLNAVAFSLGSPREIAILGDPAAPETLDLIRTVWSRFIPDRVLTVAADSSATRIPLLQGKSPLAGKPTAFVCENYSCRQPVTSTNELAALLK